jgi:hypothetical protein
MGHRCLNKAGDHRDLTGIIIIIIIIIIFFFFFYSLHLPLLTR